MTARRLSAFVDALVSGRRPRGFRASAEELSVLRTAIDLRAARSGDVTPDEQFVSNLYEELTAQAQTGAQTGDPAMVRPAPHRRRITLAAVAAAAALVVGTVAGTEAFDHPASAPAAVALPHANALRTATFTDAHHQDLGQIVVYNGSPSWVYMNLSGSSYDGQVTCRLKATNGATVMKGMFGLRDGRGELSKTIRVNVDQLVGAQLVTSTGSTLASATFS